MEKILSKFEGCLAKLEDSTFPVYTETAMLQQRQENLICEVGRKWPIAMGVQATFS